jgi:hypothetical protein
MPVNPEHAEEYELPEINESSGSVLQDSEDVERERLLDSRTSEDKLDGEDTEQIGKGTKIDDLIARVCIFLPRVYITDELDCAFSGRYDSTHTYSSGPPPRLNVLHHGRLGLSGVLLQVECAFILVLLCDTSHIPSWSSARQ